MLGSQSDMTQVAKEEQPRKDKTKSRNIMVDMNAKLSKIMLMVAER